MNKFEFVTRPLTWFMVLLLSASVAGCLGGSGGGSGAIAPAVTVVAPLPNATGVPTNTRIITAAFTKAMDSTVLTPASFTLACPGGTPIAGTVTYLAASNLAMFVLPATSSLPPSTMCTATVTAAVRDATGTPMASNFMWTFTTGAATDATAPTVTGTIHANGAVNVPVNTQVGATFSEGMDPLTITTSTFIFRQGTTIIPGAVTYTGVSAVFTPASNLAASTTYTATITTGVRSAEGNALASDFVWSWTTAAVADTTAPTVTGAIHSNGQTNVPINTKVGVTFSEGMAPLTITNANFSLKQTVTGVAVAGIVSYSGVSAVFIPLSNLAPGTSYTVTVKGGAGGVKSLEGNPMARDFVISWTTAAVMDTTPPMVTATIHGNGQTNVPINTKVGVTFSEGMDPLTITNANFTLGESLTGTAVAGTVSYSGVSAIFVPLSNLAPSTRYTVTIKGGSGGVKDLAGNPLAGDFILSWTTGVDPSVSAPMVVGTVHANGATNVAPNTNLGVTFSEWMDPLTITNANFTVRETLTGTPIIGTVNLSGVNAEFSVVNSDFGPRVPNFKTNTSYTATIKGGVGGATDLAGNSLASDYVWSWTTGATYDFIAPTVILVTPADLAQGVAINSVVNVTFSEAMSILSINAATFTVAGVTGTVTYDAINRIATFTPLSNLANNTTYTATVTTGSTDMPGNTLTVNKVWSFTTAALPVM